MKRLIMLITLLATIGFTSCEQINPQADETASGSDVQVTQGDTMGDYDNENDDNDDDNDD